MAWAQYMIPAREIPEEKTLRHFLNKFPNGMRQDCISIALKSTLRGIQHIKLLHDGEPEVNTRLIGVYWAQPDYPRHTIRVAYDESHMRASGSGGHDPAWPQVGIWGAGIVALELAYGSLPENLAPEQMVTMADNLVRILRLKLSDRTLKAVKKLPRNLQMLLDDQYVNRREKELIAKRKPKGPWWVKTILRNSLLSSPPVQPHRKRKFSRDFLTVVLKCLDKEHPTPINEILQLAFLKDVLEIDMYYFEYKVR